MCKFKNIYINKKTFISQRVIFQFLPNLQRLKRVAFPIRRQPMLLSVNARIKQKLGKEKSDTMYLVCI